MSSKADSKFVTKVAEALANEKAMHANFFYDLARALEKRGYALEAHQRGVGGTHIVLVKKNGGHTAVVPKSGNGFSAHAG